MLAAPRPAPLLGLALVACAAGAPAAPDTSTAAPDGTGEALDATEDAADVAADSTPEGGLDTAVLVPEGPCPPEGPIGAESGAVAPDVELSDCDGELHSIHDLCELDAAWLFTFSGS